MTDRATSERKRSSLFLKLFIAFLCVGLVPTLISARLHYRSQRMFLERTFASELEALAQGAQAYFQRTYAIPIPSDLGFIERSQGLNLFLTSHDAEVLLAKPEVERFFLHFTSREGTIYRSLHFFDMQGRERIATEGNRRLRRYRDLSAPGTDVVGAHMRAIFSELKAASLGSTHCTAPFMSDGRSTFLVGMAKREPEIGGFGGAVIAHCSLEEYLDYLRNVSMLDTPICWLYDKRGELLLRPRGASHAPDAAGPGCLIRRAAISVGDSGTLLQLVLHVPEGVVLARYRRALWVSVLIGGLITLAVAVAAHWLARRLVVDPLRRLSRATESLAAGDMTHRIDIKTQDELGVLAERFNEMARRIQERTDAVTRSEERFRLAAQAVSDLVYEWDMVSDDLRWFGDIDAALGYAPGEFPRTLAGWMAAIHPEDQERLGESAERHRTSKDPISEEYRIRRQDGSWRHWIDRAEPVLNADGRPIRWIGACIDVTDRVAAETALRESESKYRTLVEHLPQHVILKDADSVFVSCNENFARSLGLDVGEIAGKTDYDFYPRDLADKYRADDRQVMELGETVTVEERHIEAGQEIVVQTVKTPVKDGEGNTVGVLGIFWDITKQRKLEEQLRQSQKMDAIGQLAGGIAHDFNNLLTGILGYANLLRLESKPDTLAHDAAKTIEGAAERARELTSQLLGFARKGKHQVVPVNMHDIIQEAMRLLSRTIGPGVRVTGKLHASHCTVMGDPGQLEQVLVNLAVNARDAMSDGGELTIATEVMDAEPSCCPSQEKSPGQRYLRISVSDTGVGIPKELQERIFEPFFTTKDHGQGTGMGLAMVYGIVVDHAGGIDVESEPGQGATIRICLPLSMEARVEPTHTSAAKPVQGTGRILLADDEDVVREVAAAMLQQLGYGVSAVRNGREAVDYYKDHGQDVDLVILDMVMPEMGGRECFTALQVIDPDVRVVLSTGYDMDSRAQDILSQGVVGFVKKPYRMVDLSVVVAKAMQA